MNYFELYNIPVAFVVDKQQVKQTFYTLSRQYHPDFFTQEDTTTQQTALEMASLVNKAFKTLSNDEATLQYVLQLKGLVQEEEKYALPNDFLMEVMELNEALMDAKMEDDKDKLADIKTAITNMQKKMYESVQHIVENYQEGVTTQEALLQVKEFYYKKKYLARILVELK